MSHIAPLWWGLMRSELAMKTRRTHRSAQQGGRLLMRPLVTLVGLLTVAAISAGCDEIAAAAGSPEEVPLGGIYSAADDGWDIQITEVNVGPASDEAAGVGVALRAVNTGSKAASLGPNRFTLRDENGREWRDRTYEEVGFWVEVGLAKIQPGLSTELHLYFVTPRSVSGAWVDAIGGGRLALGNIRNANFEPAQ